MNKFITLCVIAFASGAFAEPPSGYSYSRPSGGHSSSYSSHGSSFGSFGGGHSSFSSGHSSFGGGYSSGGHGGYSSGGGHGGSFGGSGYQHVSIGHQGSEGYHVDPQLLHTIKDILIQQENLGGGGGHGGHGSHGISSTYGVPSPQYGPPGYGSSRVVGIDFGHVQQGKQVAQLLKHETHSIGGYAPSHSYGPPKQTYGPPAIHISAPSSSYGPPAPVYSAPISIPSSSYGAPSFRPSRPSSSYGVPH